MMQSKAWAPSDRIAIITPPAHARWSVTLHGPITFNLHCAPDNLDVAIPPEGGTRDTGFEFKREDAVDFAIWLADAAHSFGMGFGLKNVKGELSRLHGQETSAGCQLAKWVH
jgi:hypothetical protein